MALVWRTSCVLVALGDKEMRKLVILSCAIFFLSGCSGAGEADLARIANSFERITDAIVEELRDGREPETELVPALGPIGDITFEPFGDGLEQQYFEKWGYHGYLVREDVVTCAALELCELEVERNLFWAFLDDPNYDGVSTSVVGIQSGTSPVIGSAIWTGGVRAYEASVEQLSSGTEYTFYASVEGDARLEVDFTAVTVDVDFTDFDNGQADMSWDGLIMENGEFGSGTTSIDGSFYGADHEGAAGEFERDGLTGVFGAIRSSN